jgi:NitT/TauT family transport system permease protein
LQRGRGTATLFAYRLAVGIVGLSLWELAVRGNWVNQIFVASPTKIAQEIASLAADGTLILHVGETLKVAALGFVAGMAVGVLLGLVLGLTPRVADVFAPYITVMNSAPRIALAPLFVLWFGIGSLSGIVLVFTLVVFIALTNALAGAQSVDRHLVRLARLLGANRAELVVKIILPWTVPWIIAAARLSFAYALAGATVSEMFLGDRGLGYLIVAGSGVFNIPLIFAALVLVITTAWLLDVIALSLEKRLLRWRAPIGT